MLSGDRVGLAFVVSLLYGCGGKTTEAEPPPQPQPAAVIAPSSAAPDVEEAERLRGELGEALQSLEAATEKGARLSNELAALKEANKTLELELTSALEEILRSQSSLRNVQSRAFAISRISEVRVELVSFRPSRDPAVRTRIARADEFLTRADEALAQDNFGGAAYLAERAGELLRQARTIKESGDNRP